MKTTTISTDNQLIKALNEIKADSNTTDLTRAVIEMLRDSGKDYTNGIKGYMSDIMQHGCISGTVSQLIYYSDTDKFFDAHSQDIFYLANETKESIGELPFELSKNNLAWFAFEKMVYNLSNTLGILGIE